jgi:hypothetical protein
MTKAHLLDTTAVFAPADAAAADPTKEVKTTSEKKKPRPRPPTSEPDTPALARQLHASFAQQAGLSEQPQPAGVARRGQPQARAPPKQRHGGAYSVAEFCEAYGVSVPLLYKLWARGEGPDVMKVGVRTLISIQAADRWRRERERAARQLKKQATP